MAEQRRKRADPYRIPAGELEPPAPSPLPPWMMPDPLASRPPLPPMPGGGAGAAFTTLEPDAPALLPDRLPSRFPTEPMPPEYLRRPRNPRVRTLDLGPAADNPQGQSLGTVVATSTRNMTSEDVLTAVSQYKRTHAKALAAGERPSATINGIQIFPPHSYGGLVTGGFQEMVGPALGFLETLGMGNPLVPETPGQMALMTPIGPTNPMARLPSGPLGRGALRATEAGVPAALAGADLYGQGMPAGEAAGTASLFALGGFILKTLQAFIPRLSPRASAAVEREMFETMLNAERGGEPLFRTTERTLANLVAIGERGLNSTLDDIVGTFNRAVRGPNFPLALERQIETSLKTMRDQTRTLIQGDLSEASVRAAADTFMGAVRSLDDAFSGRLAAVRPQDRARWIRQLVANGDPDMVRVIDNSIDRGSPQQVEALTMLKSGARPLDAMKRSRLSQDQLRDAVDEVWGRIVANVKQNVNQQFSAAIQRDMESAIVLGLLKQAKVGEGFDLQKVHRTLQQYANRLMPYAQLVRDLNDLGFRGPQGARTMTPDAPMMPGFTSMAEGLSSIPGMAGIPRMLGQTMQALPRPTTFAGELPPTAGPPGTAHLPRGTRTQEAVRRFIGLSQPGLSRYFLDRREGREAE